MKTSKMDKHIKETLKDRKITPSNSAWERLSVQLDEETTYKRRGMFFYTAIAASILLLISVGVHFFIDNSIENAPKENLVTSPIQKNSIDKKVDKLINEIPVEEALVKNAKTPESPIKIENTIVDKEKIISRKINSKPLRNKEQVIAKITTEDKKLENNISTKETNTSNKKLYKRDPNSTIKINSEDLLYAVTHSPKEVKQYYAKYNLTRDDILKTIKSELKKSNIKVSPNIILAEVERTIDEEDFKNNFMKSLKTKISDIATVIASRND